MGLLDGLFDIVGGAINLTGSIVGLSLGTVAKALNISETMVKTAKDAGCETVEEIKEFWNL